MKCRIIQLLFPLEVNKVAFKALCFKPLSLLKQSSNCCSLRQIGRHEIQYPTHLAISWLQEETWPQSQQTSNTLLQPWSHLSSGQEGQPGWTLEGMCFWCSSILFSSRHLSTQRASHPSRDISCFSYLAYGSLPSTYSFPAFYTGLCSSAESLNRDGKMHVSCPSVPLLLRSLLTLVFLSQAAGNCQRGPWPSLRLKHRSKALFSSQGTLNFFAVLPPCTCLSLPLPTNPHLDFKAKLQLITNTLFTHKGKGEDRVEFGSENTQENQG